MRRTRVKFCGLTRVEDIRRACDLQVDAVGLVLVPASSRFLTLERATTLINAVAKPTRSVLLFLNPDVDDVKNALNVLNPDLLQFHGTESEAFCEQFGVPWIKALSEAVAAKQMAAHSRACKLLIDSHQPGAMGGTGETIDAARFPGDSDGSRWVIAGGLNPDNAAACIRRLRPFAVDVSSGIESSPGIKDRNKMTDFMNQVRAADDA